MFIYKAGQRYGNDCIIHTTAILQEICGDFVVTELTYYTGWAGQSQDESMHKFEKEKDARVFFDNIEV